MPLAQSGTLTAAAASSAAMTPPDGATEALVGVTGTDFDSATAKAQFSPDGGTTWVDYGADATWTAAGTCIIAIFRGTTVRFTQSGGGGSESIPWFFKWNPPY